MSTSSEVRVGGNGRPRRAPPGWAAGLPVRTAAAVLLGSIASAVRPEPVAAQSGSEILHEQCTEGVSSPSSGLSVRCADAALAFHALQGGVGLALTAGGPLPASPSTVGRRLATQPRVLVDGGVTWATFRVPDLSGGYDHVAGPAPDRKFVTGVKGTVLVGVFEGFSPLPGVGGVLSVDAVGTAHLLRMDGLDGASESVFAWGGGVRLGVFRESFSLPGLTLSAMHHRAGAVEYGATGASTGTVRMRPRATSLRAIVGKDLLVVGLAAGVGWDKYATSGEIEARGPPVAIPPSGALLSQEGTGGPVDSTVRKRYVFVGANLTWLVVQLAGDVAWVWEASPAPPLEGSGPYRPGGTELQGAITLRITY